MKLPDELEKAWWNASMLGAQNDLIEAIVRDCVKVVREYGTKHRPLNKAADAILARYSLEPK